MADFDIAAYVSRIEANRSVKDALMQSLKTRRPPYRISVTDLLNLKQAYFKRKYPEITPPLEKQQLMWAGTGFHKTFGSAVSSEEYLEQFVEAEGIVGKIDIYEKIPVEVKTTSTPVDTKDLLQYRLISSNWACTALWSMPTREKSSSISALWKNRLRFLHWLSITFLSPT